MSPLSLIVEMTRCLMASMTDTEEPFSSRHRAALSGGKPVDRSRGPTANVVIWLQIEL